MMMVLRLAGAVIALAALGGTGAGTAKPYKYKPDKFGQLRSECDRHLSEARKSKDFYKRLDECNRRLANYRLKQRDQAIKSWRKREKDWRKRHKVDAKHPYQDWRY
jgi:hypothetical protein